jgi:hypothetical protein
VKLAALVCGLAILAGAGVAVAEEGDPLDRARTLFRRFEFEDAVAELATMVADESIPRARRVEALELKGVLEFDLGREPDARASFEAMLGLDPERVPSDPAYPPRSIEFFERVRDEVRAAAAPEPVVEAPPTVAPVAPTPVEPERPRWYRQWWVWTIVGVVVAGTVTGVAVGTTAGGEDERGSLGAVYLP